MNIYKCENTKTKAYELIQAADISEISCLLWDKVTFFKRIE